MVEGQTFLACPISGYGGSTAILNALELADALAGALVEAGYPVSFAGSRYLEEGATGRAPVGPVYAENVRRLRASSTMVLIVGEPSPESSVWIEFGFGLAMGIPIAVVARDRELLPLLANLAIDEAPQVTFLTSAEHKDVTVRNVMAWRRGPLCSQ